MKASAVLKQLAVTLSVVFLFFGTNVALANQGDGTDGPAVQNSSQPLIVNEVPTYRVGYMYSTTASPRRAMVISITNNSSLPCDTTVRWLRGDNELIGTSSVTLLPGETLEHCSRSLPFATVVCNAISSPEVAPPPDIEGKADVHLASACESSSNIDAKQYYMTGENDEDIAGVYRAATIRGNNFRGD